MEKEQGEKEKERREWKSVGKRSETKRMKDRKGRGKRNFIKKREL